MDRNNISSEHKGQCVAEDVSQVASLTEAWIETPIPSTVSGIWMVASLAEAWIETSHGKGCEVDEGVASLAEAWIETSAMRKTGSPWTSRLSRRGVDLNFSPLIHEADMPGDHPARARVRGSDNFSRKASRMPADDSLSVQLYSLRLMPSPDEQLRLVRSCGLSFVEANSACLDDAAGFRKLLDRHGLTAPSGHIGIDALRDSPARAADLCGTIGINLLTLWGFPDVQALSTEEQWARAGQELGVLAESLAGNGITFAFHNHDWELADFGKGRIALDVLFEAARGSPLRWQADLAWLARGHADVGAITKRHRDLICACHVKDLAPGPRNAPEDGWADLGQGILPWHDWWPKMKDYGAIWMVLEHDAPSDPRRFLTRSAAAARAITAESAS